MPAGALGTWPTIAEIEKEKEWQRAGGWNMKEEESRKITNNQAI